jgi:hypothetical protein
MYAAQMHLHNQCLFSSFGHAPYFYSLRSFAKIRNLVIQNPQVPSFLLHLTKLPLTCISCSPQNRSFQSPLRYLTHNI